MYTKDDFLEVIKNTAKKQPLTTALMQAGDGRIMQIQEAMATMLAMISEQVDLCSAEPFVKARDSTVLADNSIRGGVFTAKPARGLLSVVNASESSLSLDVGRVLIDQQGYQWKVVKAVNFDGLATDINLEVEQIVTEKRTIIADNPNGFYSIELDYESDNGYISSISVTVNDDVFLPCYKFNAVAVGDKVFHVESNERKQVVIKFGLSGVLGYGVKSGDKIKIDLNLTFGDVATTKGDPFVLDYLNEGEDALSFEFKKILVSGVKPFDIAILRELSKYPSVYDDNAVYLGEFERLLRLKFSDFNYIRVWNEQEEERVRGINVENVNTLFYSYSVNNDLQLVYNTANFSSLIEDELRKADNSYKFKHVSVVDKIINIKIKARISKVFNHDDVKDEIKTIILNQYSKESIKKKSLKNGIILHKDIYNSIINLPALKDLNSDLTVEILNNKDLDKPEFFYFVADNSLTIELETTAGVSHLWKS